MKKHVSILLMIVLLSVSFGGCTSEVPIEAAPVEPVVDQRQDVKVGVIISTLLNPFFVDVKDGLVFEADQYNLDLVLLDSRDDSQLEKSHMQTLINEKVDAIVLNATDPDAPVSMIEEAVKVGIKVVTIDRVINSDKVSVHVTSDNYTGGKLAGHFVLEQLEGKGHVVELLGIDGASVDGERGAGFQHVLNGSEVEIIEMQRADFDRLKGQSVMEDLLQKYANIDAVFAHNDEMALGALKAVTQANRKIVVVGFDGIDDAVIAVQDGSMGATIAQQPKEIGIEGIRTVMKLMNNESVDETVYVPLKLITSLTNE